MGNGQRSQLLITNCPTQKSVGGIGLPVDFKVYSAGKWYLGATMFKQFCAAALLLVAMSGVVGAGYLDENPGEVSVYERISALPVQAARDPFVWLRLEELKREPCDQKSIGDLALMLDKLGYRRQAAEGPYRFVKESEYHDERFPLRGQKTVVTVKAEINGVRGLFILDTGASYLSVKSAFAERAKISLTGASEITLITANGQAKARLAKADKVTLGTLQAANVPVAVQDVDEKNYGAGVDDLLGMSFLSRFEVQIADNFVEVRTRQPKKH